MIVSIDTERGAKWEREGLKYIGYSKIQLVMIMENKMAKSVSIYSW